MPAKRPIPVARGMALWPVAISTSCLLTQTKPREAAMRTRPMTTLTPMRQRTALDIRQAAAVHSRKLFSSVWGRIWEIFFILP